jgi:hypothetical protein
MPREYAGVYLVVVEAGCGSQNTASFAGFSEASGVDESRCSASNLTPRLCRYTRRDS